MTGVAYCQKQSTDSLQTTQWGESVNGLEMRIYTPNHIPFAEPIKIDVELRKSPSSLINDTIKINPNLEGRYLTMVFADEDGKISRLYTLKNNLSINTLNSLDKVSHFIEDIPAIKPLGGESQYGVYFLQVLYNKSTGNKTCEAWTLSIWGGCTNEPEW